MVLKRLTDSEILVKQLIKRKKEMKLEKEKSLFAQVISGNSIFKKYKMMRKSNSIVSAYLQRKNMNRKELILHRSNEKKLEVRLEMKKNIRQFLEKDENSAVAPGAKETISRNGEKKRKRYILDSVDNLHKKFCASSKTEVSRATFYRLKPY